MEEDKEEDELETINIARRTRSHVKIDDSVLNDNLQLPDVDMNLYQNPGSEPDPDPDYNNFLNRLYSNDFGQDTNTDDNDTEYVYNNDIYSHGWTFDLNEIQGLNDTNSKDFVALTSVPTEEAKDQLRLTGNLRSSDVFSDPKFAQVLNQQLRQHIQLLTQTYILTKNAANLRHAAESSEENLQSYLKIFKDRRKPSNLLPALELIKNYTTREHLRPSVRFTWRPLPLPESIKKTIRENPNIFAYSNLLPEVSYSFLEKPRTKPEKPEKPVAPAKDTFTKNEDKLLTYALHEFRGEAAKYHLISTLLMTTKSKKQIINHVKNIKRSPSASNPIKLYFETGKLPEIDQDNVSPTCYSSDNMATTATIATTTTTTLTPASTTATETTITTTTEVDPSSVEQNRFREALQPQAPQTPLIPTPLTGQEYRCDSQQKSQESPPPTKTESNMELEVCEKNQECDNIMDMDLDDLVAASSTISKPAYSNSNINNSENKYIRNLKLRKSMLYLMTHNFTLSENMGNLIVDEFLSSAKQKLSERNYLHLLQLLTDLSKKKEPIELIYSEIIKFLTKIEAPVEFRERVVLFLDLRQATKCGCAMSYLHWMRFFEFMQHMELYHDGAEVLEKKLVRLIDALQKDDSHKIKLAVANMLNKHPFLKREYESLCLNEKPHQSLFICEEDFDDITEPLSHYESLRERGQSQQQQTSPQSITKTARPRSTADETYKFEHFSSKVTKEELSYASQHCPCKCHTEAPKDGQPSQHCGRCNLKFMRGRMYLVNKIKPILAEWSYVEPTEVQWTFEEDRDILEFCRCKAERSEETVSFDSQTFEELASGSGIKKTAREIAKRFNDLMDIYKDSIGQPQQ